MGYMKYAKFLNLRYADYIGNRLNKKDSSMKKYILVLLVTLICTSTISFATSKGATNQSLSSAIRMYKAGNYSGCYTALNDIVKRDPSNPVAYYYLAMTSAQIGKKDEAIENYSKVINLSPNGRLGTYATKGKVCLETPDKCNESDALSELDNFVNRKFGSGFSEKARSDYEKNKIENLMREINRNGDVAPQKFKEYKDFSSEVPTNDEIVAAMRVLQRAGFNNGYSSDISLLTGGQSNDAMLNMMFGGGRSNLSPQVIQSLLTNQMSTGF